MKTDLERSFTIGDRVAVGYFGRRRVGTVVKVGRTRIQVKVVMPSNHHVWLKMFSMKKVERLGLKSPRPLSPCEGR